MHSDDSKRDTGGFRPADGADAALWRDSREAEAIPDERARFLDLAGFADGTLDPDDTERVADWLAGDPEAAADVAAARALAGAALPAVPQAVAARAAALVGTGAGQGAGQGAEIVVLRPRPRTAPRLAMRGAAGWGSLAAAVVLAGWLGFALGTTASRSLAPTAQTGEAAFLSDLIDPPVTFASALTEGTRT